MYRTLGHMARTSKGFLLVAKKLQEQAELSHDDIRKQLSDALSDIYRGTGTYCYLVDIFGNDQAGSVVYSCDSDLMQASYTMANTDGARSCKIDTENAVEVLPKTVYEPEAAEQVTESISSVTPSAGSPGLQLVESAAFLSDLSLKEADAPTEYPVKLIAPGKGSSAFYPAEVLKRDGPTTFKAGMHMYWNHQTAAEEAARPEGDMSHLAAVLTSNAYYDESGAKGPGLYAKAKVFSDYAQKVQEKAKYTGLSIRAMGEAEPNVQREGRPVLSKFTAGESVDFVTHAGAGGIVLTESANAAEENVMDAVQLKEFNDTKAKLTLAEAELQKNGAALLKVNQRLALGEASRVADRYFGTLQGIAPGIVSRVTERLLKGTIPMTEAGELDMKKFEEALAQEVKDETKYISDLTGGARIQGLGPAAQPTPEQLAEADKDFDKRFAETLGAVASVFVGDGDEFKKGREVFVQGRAN